MGIIGLYLDKVCKYRKDSLLGLRYPAYLIMTYSQESKKNMSLTTVINLLICR